MTWKANKDIDSATEKLLAIKEKQKALNKEVSMLTNWLKSKMDIGDENQDVEIVGVRKFLFDSDDCEDFLRENRKFSTCLSIDGKKVQAVIEELGEEIEEIIPYTQTKKVIIKKK